MASAAQMAKDMGAVESPRGKFFSDPRHLTAVLSLLIFLLTLIVYNPVLRNGFVSFDDPEYITANPHITAGLSWDTVKWAFRSTEQANWHPITWLSHALDWQLFHQNAAGHHYMSVLLHALTSVLLFLFLQAATGFVWRSAAVATLFAIHPVNVESVAWAAERKSVLSMLFFVLMLIAYRWYAQNPEWKRYGLVALLFAMGLMSKPMLVTAPFLLLLLDYWPLERTKTVSTLRLALEKLPLFAMSAASCVVTMIAQRASSAIHSGDFALSDRLENAIVCYAHYIRNTVWPPNLASFYPHPEHLPLWQVTTSLALLIALTTIALWRQQQRYLIVGWLWFMGSLVPMIGVVQAGEQAMADRYAYLPFVGLFVAIIWVLCDSAKRPVKHSLAVAGCGTVVVLSLMTCKQIEYWKDTKTLWTHTLSVTSRNPVAESSLGAELIAEGDVQGAITHLKAGIEINPRDPFSHLDLGVCEKQLGNIPLAIGEYQTALRLASDSSLRRAAYRNLGAAYRIEGDYARARSNYEEALQILPNDAVALTGLGLVAIRSGDSYSAVGYFSQAVKAMPSDTGYLLLARALAGSGHQQESQTAYEKAQRLSPNLSSAAHMVDRLLQQ